MSITSDSPSESEGLSDVLNNGTVKSDGLVTRSEASVVFMDSVMEAVGGAVVVGVGGITEIGSIFAADIVLDEAAGVVLDGAEGSVMGGAKDSVMGAAEDSVMSGAKDSVMGGAEDSVMGGAKDSVMDGAEDSVMGGATDSTDVLVVVDEIALTVDLVANKVSDKVSATRVGGAVDTIAEAKLEVDEFTLYVLDTVTDVGGAAAEVGGAVVAMTVTDVGKAAVVVGEAAVVGGAAVGVDVITELVGADKVTTVGIFMDKVTEVAEGVREDKTVVAATVGVAEETTVVIGVGIVEDTIDSLISDITVVVVIESSSAGGLVKVTFCSSSDCSVSSPLVSSLSFWALKGLVSVSPSHVLGSLVVVEFNEKSKLLGLVAEVVTAVLKRLMSDFEDSPLTRGAVPLVGLEKLVSDFENRLPSVLLLVEKLKGRTV